MADALSISLDYLAGEDEAEPKETTLDKDMNWRIKEIANLSDKDKDKILSIVDAFIRDTKTKLAYRIG